jgi:TolA-binding protein
MAGLLAATTLAGVLVLVPAARWWRTDSSTLSYQIRGGSVADGGYLRESGPGGIQLRFAEGTEMSFLPGTRGRLRSVGSHGARIAIEHGKASFHVTPRREADWSVEVGPFLVTVKGTVFTVAWDVVTERFDLVLEHGLVSVTGPVSSGAVLLKTGQRLAVDLPRKETLISEPSPEVPSSAATQGRNPSGPGETPPPSAAETYEGRMPTSGLLERKPLEAKTDVRRGWPQAVAAGNWDRVLAEVDRAGVKQTLATASSDDLLALADAARYRRRSDLARSALLAERKRFPGSASALDAAYLLGRLAESGPGGADDAVRWYDTYLAGAPSGPYASEALGRKMTAINRLHGSSEARAFAREYLRRFPTGSYAGAARALLVAP